MKEVIERLKEQSNSYAFPFVSQEVFCSGMTLRDYFAASAMQGFASYCGACDDPQWRPGAAYKWADAMLKARETNQGDLNATR